MKRILLILLILTSFSLKSQSKKLSLSECIDLAIENNENLKNSILEEKISKALSNEYLSIGFPQINFDGGIKYNHEVPKSLLDISRFMPGVPEGTEQEVQFGQAYDGRVDLFVNQMIFNGSYFVGLSAAKELVKLSEKMTERNVIDIHESVSKADYTILQVAICELKHIPHTPAKVVIKEYSSIADAYNSDVSFVNAILDKTARLLRAEEMGAS